MNGKKARRLREVAESITIDKPMLSYEKHIPAVYQFFNGKMFKTQKGVPLKLGQCTRKAYQAIKKESYNWST